MIKLVCKNCGKHWYTANTRYTGTCEICDGKIEEDKGGTINIPNRIKNDVKPILRLNENE